MSYLNRQPGRKRAGSAELVYLLVVLAAGGATFWWAGHMIGMDLSALVTVATILGVRDTRAVHYDARPPTTLLKSLPAEQAAAPYCNPGQSPAFVLGLAELKQRLGDVMGTPTECEHASSAAGDTVQQTTTGLAAYSKASNTVTFTDGWRHWALHNRDLITWEGTEPDPPSR